MSETITTDMVFDAIYRLDNDVEVAETWCLQTHNNLKSTTRDRKSALERRNLEVYQAVIRFLEDAGQREPINV